ncbi:thioesterase II family protein [Pyxidicoccus xibeiensis]|uniref:thioesterase II family protein n=1 Tax=Pyxidicoccus xibeiensis TaxID=2906759 RepID=UPI0020A6E77C|nr:alpha/beta fold hydrolase [Pyxidicoccus xibeiensis]MCP3137812.1 alpha/beta fold hydrolase [Pyxidicoccus xibeiensis]
MNAQWLYRRPSPAARLRLFCLPYAGGGSSIYSRWQGDFPEDIEVCAVELPGRRARLREPPIRRAAALVEAIAEGVAPFLDLPFVFFGHSMGALLAFELARHLRRVGRQGPCALFVSAAAAPHLPRSRKLLWRLGDAEFLSEIRGYGGTPEEVFSEPDLRALFLPVLRADFEVFDTYEFEDDGPLACPLHVYGGRDDERATPGQLRAWGELASHLESVELFPGGHFYLHEQRPALTAAVARELAAFVPGRR